MRIQLFPDLGEAADRQTNAQHRARFLEVSAMLEGMPVSPFQKRPWFWEAAFALSRLSVPAKVAKAVCGDPVQIARELPVAA